MTTEHGLTWLPTGRRHDQETEYSAAIPYGSRFWSVWRVKKEKLKETGLKVMKDARGNYIANMWQCKITNTIEETPLEPLLNEINYSGLLPWQHRNVSDIVRSLRQNKAALDASDVGTGKTFSALKAFQHLGTERLLVVCPKSVIPSWYRAAKHFNMDIEVVNYELVRRLTTGYTSGYYHDNSFKWDKTIDGIIFDECHKCKGMESLNSKLLLQAKKDKINTLMLSATTACNPLELKAVGFTLGFFVGTESHSKWLQSVGVWCKPDTIGYKPDPTVMKNINRSIFPKYGCRTRVADLGDTFPETFITTDYLPVTTDSATLINEAYAAAAIVKANNAQREQSLAYIEKIKATEYQDKNTKLTAATMIEEIESRMKEYQSPLAAMMYARQISEAAKVPSVIEQILDAVEGGNSVAVFVNFTATIEALKDTLSHTNLSVVQGGQKAHERESEIAAFQSDKTRIILLNIDAGGTGVNLHDLNGNYPRISIVFPSYSAVTLRQALGRVHRAGGKTKSIQRIIFAANTIEEEIATAIDRKLKNLDALNDGDLN